MSKDTEQAKKGPQKPLFLVIFSAVMAALVGTGGGGILGHQLAMTRLKEERTQFEKTLRDERDRFVKQLDFKRHKATIDQVLAALEAERIAAKEDQDHEALRESREALTDLREKLQAQLSEYEIKLEELNDQAERVFDELRTQSVAASRLGDDFDRRIADFEREILTSLNEQQLEVERLTRATKSVLRKAREAAASETSKALVQFNLSRAARALRPGELEVEEAVSYAIHALRLSEEMATREILADRETYGKMYRMLSTDASVPRATRDALGRALREPGFPR